MTSDLFLHAAGAGLLFVLSTTVADVSTDWHPLSPSLVVTSECVVGTHVIVDEEGLGLRKYVVIFPLPLISVSPLLSNLYLFSLRSALCQQEPHTIMHEYILLQVVIKIHDITQVYYRVRKAVPVMTNHNNYRHSRISNVLVCVRTAVDETGHAVALHATGRVHSVPEQAVSRHLLPHHASHHRARVNAHSYLLKQLQELWSK